MKKNPGAFYFYTTVLYFLGGFLYCYLHKNYLHLFVMGLLCYILYELQIIKSKIDSIEIKCDSEDTDICEHDWKPSVFNSFTYCSKCAETRSDNN
jgi:hypothetical protein